MSRQSANPSLKPGLEILRDSLLTTALLTVAAVAFSGRLTPSFVFYTFAEIGIYATIMMFLAHTTYGRIWPLVHKLDDKTQWTVFVIVMIVLSGIASFAGSLLIRALGWESDTTFAFLFERSFKVCAVVSLLIGINEAAFSRLQGQLEDTKSKLHKEELERE